MKQLLIVSLSLASLIVPGFATTQSTECFLVCNPSRVYCQPSGAVTPPIYKLCAVTVASLHTPETAQTEPTCAGQQVLDEDTQTYEWQMVCD